MNSLVLRWFLHALSLYIVASILPGIHVDGFMKALIASAIIGLLNLIIKPILIFLTLPVTVVTLGFFVFVINALMFLLASFIAPGFQVDGIGTALAGSILFTIITMILNGFIR